MAKRICAWCNKVLGEAEGEYDTHGICDDCKEEVLDGNYRRTEVSLPTMQKRLEMGDTRISQDSYIYPPQDDL